MAKFTQVDGAGRGAPRVNKSNHKGNVRVTITMPSKPGNVSRSLTFENATVTEIFSAIQDALVAQTA